MIYYDENITVLYQVNYWSVPEESSPDCPVVLQYTGLYGALERCRVVIMYVVQRIRRAGV
jgi:hypothetical protein